MSSRSSRRSWSIRALLLVLVLTASLLSGCTGAQNEQGPDDGADGPSEEEPSDGVDPGELVPEGLGSLVQEVPGPDRTGDGVTGYVFHETTRELIEGAKVVVQCLRGDQELPTSPHVLETDKNGHFALPAGGPLADCKLVSYQALHPGLLQETLLTGPALETESAYLVLIGLSSA